MASTKVDFRSRLTQYARSMDRRKEKALDKVGSVGQRVARTRARKRTGRMRAEIVWNDQADRLEAHAPYTKYHEHGTRYVRARPMFEPAEQAMRVRLEGEFRDAFDPGA